MKNWLCKTWNNQVGQVLPAVLAALVIGSLLIVPSLSYVSTSLKTGETVEKNVKGLYAADAGIEHALWYLQGNYSTINLPYQGPPSPLEVNGMKVTYTIGEIDLVGGDLARIQPHAQDMNVQLYFNGAALDGPDPNHPAPIPPDPFPPEIIFTPDPVTQSGEVNLYLWLTNQQDVKTGAVDKVKTLILDLPPGFEYSPPGGETTAQISTTTTVKGKHGDPDVTTVTWTDVSPVDPPTINGGDSGGVTLRWDGGTHGFIYQIPPGEMVEQVVHLNAPVLVNLSEAQDNVFWAVRVSRGNGNTDIGWVTTYFPYAIVSTAWKVYHAKGHLDNIPQTVIRADIWLGQTGTPVLIRTYAIDR